MRKLNVFYVVGLAALVLIRMGILMAQERVPLLPQAPAATHSKAIFEKPIPADQLAFLRQFAGKSSNDVVRDEQFRELLERVIRDCMISYGTKDMPLREAIEKVITGSPFPAQIRAGRYVTVAGDSGPYLRGRGFIWIDMQDGFVLGGFYNEPRNGEPTPTLTISSKQLRVKGHTVTMSQLPPAFAEDLRQWSQAFDVPPITARYFISGFNRKILLKHSEDYCASTGGTAVPAEANCEKMNATAADIDMNAAHFLDQTSYATNATNATKGVFVKPEYDSDGPLVGSWLNENPKTRGIAKILVEQSGDVVTVHAWQKCGSSDRDLGSEKGLAIGDSAIVAWDQGLVLRKWAISRMGDRLQLKADSVYRDSRPPQHTAEFFARSK
jgi:hypothetical protein